MQHAAASGSSDRLDSSKKTSFNEITEGKFLKSKNGTYELIMQADGNLVGYEPHDGKARPFWATHTSGAHGHFRLVMQEDGNLVVYDGNDAVKWATHTSHSSPHGPYIAVMQNDRNIVVYDGADKVVWASKTVV